MWKVSGARVSIPEELASEHAIGAKNPLKSTLRRHTGRVRCEFLHMYSSTRSLHVAIALGIAFIPPALAAQQPVGSRPGVTLTEAIALALRQNPDVLIARTIVDSARSEHRITGALPNPTLSGNPNTPYQYAASIALDLSPGRFYRSRAAMFGVNASEADRNDAVRQITLSVARAFFDVLLAQEKRQLAADRRDAVRQLLAADSVRYRSGDVALHNLVRSELEMARSDAEVARAEVAVQLDRGLLQGLLGIAHPDTAFTAIGSLDYQRLDAGSDSLVRLALSRRPDLSASHQRVEQSRMAQRSASSLLVPTPVLSYVRQYAGPFDNGRYYSLGLSFELPSLNLFGGQRDRAAAGGEAARLAYRRVEIQLDRDVTTALAEFHIQRALVERFQSGLLTRVNESVNAVRYAYARGANSLLEVLDAVRSQQDVRTDYYAALHDYWVSVYSLNAAVGTDVFAVVR